MAPYGGRLRRGTQSNDSSRTGSISTKSWFLSALISNAHQAVEGVWPIFQRMRERCSDVDSITAPAQANAAAYAAMTAEGKVSENGASEKGITNPPA